MRGRSTRLMLCPWFPCFKDVDQVTGEDLNPSVNKMLAGAAGREEPVVARNPDRYAKGEGGLVGTSYRLPLTVSSLCKPFLVPPPPP